MAQANTVFDAIVIGVGSMGAPTCYQLAQRGCKVLGIEQFIAPHPFGAHSGQTRITRKAYFEHPDYVPLLKKTYESVAALEEMTGTQLYHQTGLVYFGPPDHALMEGVRHSASLYQIPLERVNAQEAKERFPQFHLPDHYETLFEPEAGFLLADRVIAAYIERALLLGARIHMQETVLEWKKNERGIEVTTDKGRYQAKKLVITAGPWAGKMIPALQSALRVTRQTLAWTKPKRWDDFALGRLPCWLCIDETQPGSMFGFPMLPAADFGGPLGLKSGHHYPGEICDPDQIERKTSVDQIAQVQAFFDRFMPDACEYLINMSTCMYTNTPDENFILDLLPGLDGDVAVAAGFSGHGFKFAPVIGEIMADLALEGRTSQPVGFLSAERLSIA